MLLIFDTAVSASIAIWYGLSMGGAYQCFATTSLLRTRYLHKLCAVVCNAMNDAMRATIVYSLLTATTMGGRWFHSTPSVCRYSVPHHQQRWAPLQNYFLSAVHSTQYSIRINHTLTRCGITRLAPHSLPHRLPPPQPQRRIIQPLLLQQTRHLF